MSVRRDAAEAPTTRALSLNAVLSARATPQSALKKQSPGSTAVQTVLDNDQLLQMIFNTEQNESAYDDKGMCNLVRRYCAVSKNSCTESLWNEIWSSILATLADSEQNPAASINMSSEPISVKKMVLLWCDMQIPPSANYDGWASAKYDGWEIDDAWEETPLLKVRFLQAMTAARYYVTVRYMVGNASFHATLDLWGIPSKYGLLEAVSEVFHTTPNSNEETAFVDWMEERKEDALNDFANADDPDPTSPSEWERRLGERGIVFEYW
jgi:hypothetical protein